MIGEARSTERAGKHTDITVQRHTAMQYYITAIYHPILGLGMLWCNTCATYDATYDVSIMVIGLLLRYMECYIGPINGQRIYTDISCMASATESGHHMQLIRH